MDTELSELLKGAFPAHLSNRDLGDLEPQFSYLLFDSKEWRVESVGGEMVVDQLIKRSCANVRLGLQRQVQAAVMSSTN